MPSTSASRSESSRSERPRSPEDKPDGALYDADLFRDAGEGALDGLLPDPFHRGGSSWTAFH